MGSNPGSSPRHRTWGSAPWLTCIVHRSACECASWISSAASAASPWGSSALACGRSRSARWTSSAVWSCASAGRTCPSSRTCGRCAERTLKRTSSAVASPARTSPSLAPERALPVSGQDSGESSPGWLARYDPATSSWRTSQRSFNAGSELFSETWPESGTTRNGLLYPRAPWVPHTCDDDCSLWPTPTASMDGRGFGIPLHDRTGRYKRATVSRTRALVLAHGWRIHPRFTEALMGFPSEWTAIEPSETLLPPMSRKRSGAR
jgi:hypothetical protein